MKTRAELNQEIQQLRQRVTELQSPDISCHAIFADIEEGYYEITLTGDIKRFNESLCTILGYPAGDLSRMSYWQLMNDASARQASEAFERVLQTGKAIKTSLWEINTKTGEKRILSASISLMRSEAGEPLGFQGIVRDVTERKQAEARYEKLLDTLEHRNTLLRTAAELSQATSGILKPDALLSQVVNLLQERFDLYHVGLFLVDHTGQWADEANKWAVLRASAGVAAQGLSKQDHKVDLKESSTISWAITHKKAHQYALSSDEERASFDNYVFPMTQTELVLPLIDRDEAIGALTIQSVQASAFSDEDVAALQMMAKQLANAIANAHLYDAIERELAERKRTEKALRLSEERHRTLIENANEAIFVIQDGELKFFNSQLVKMTGYSSETFESVPFIRFVHPDDREMVQRYHIQRLQGKDAPTTYTFRAVDNDGRTKWAQLSAVTISWEGQPAVLSFMADITQQKLAEQALRESEERYRNIFETAAYSIWEEDFSAVKTALDELQAQGVSDIRSYLEEHPEFVQRVAQMIQIVDVNETTLDMFGAESKAEMLGALDQIVFPETEEILREEFIAIAEGRTHFAGETVNRTLDGKRLNVMVTMSIPSDPDKLDHVLVSLIDITDRVHSEEERARAEEALRQAHQELAQYTDNLERRTAQLQVGAEVAREAAAILDVQQLLDTVVRLISERFGFYHAGVFLIDDPGEYAVLRAASSEGGQRMLARSHKLRVGKVGIVGHVAKTGEPRIALDVGEDAVFFDNPDLPETRSEMGLPLNIRGQIIGVLDVQDTREAAFTEDDVAVLQTLADQLAVALDNARLIERAEAQLRELSVLYGEYSAATWADLVSQKRSLDYVYDRVDVREAEQLPVPAIDQALSRGEIISYNEPQASGKTLAAPLKLHDQIIGSIGIQESNGGQSWSADEIALIEAVSEQVALALENARHFAETQKSAQQMRILNEMSQALTTRLDVDGVIAETYWGASRLLDTTNFYIALYDEDTNMISFPMAVEDGMQVEWASRKASDGLTEYIIHHRTHLFIPENLSGWMAELDIEVIGQQSESWLGVPLSLGERVMGVMAVQSESPNAYTERDKDLMTAIASQTTIALQNASLFEQTSTRAEELSILNELSQALASRLDVNEVLEQAYRGASRLMRANNFSIGLYNTEKNTITFALHITESKVDKEINTISANQGLSGYVIRHRQELLIPEDVSGRMTELDIDQVGEVPQSWLGVPLLVGDQVLGVMMVQSFSTPRAYDESDLSLMQAIANQTAIALQNAHLFQETESALSETEALYLVGETISRLGPLDETFEMLADVLVGQLGYAHAWLGIIDKQTGMLAEIASAGVPSGDRISQLGLDDQVDHPALQAIDQRQAIVIDAASEREKHVVDVPIIVGGEASGLIAVHRPGDSLAISQRDLGVLNAVADQAAVALQNANLLEEIRRRATQLAAAAEVARDATAILDVDELLDQTVHLISEQFGYYHAGVFLLDDVEEYAVLHAASSEGGQRMLAREHKLPVGKIGIVGNVAATGEPHIALDVGEDAVHFANPDLPNTHSEMGLPLTVRNRVIGVLDVQSTQEAAFSEEDVAVLQTLADQLASAIANARLFQEARTRADELTTLNELGQKLSTRIDEREILEEVYQQAAHLVDASNLYIALYDQAKEEINLVIDVIDGDMTKPWANWKARRGFTEYVIRKRRTVIAQDSYADWADAAIGMGVHTRASLVEKGVRIPLSALGAPLVAGDEVLGVIAIRDYDNPRAYDRHDQDLLTSIANQAATALQNVSLFEEARRRATQLAAAAEVARDATAILDVDELLDQTVHLISEQFGYYHAGVFLLDDVEEYAVLHAASSEGGQRMLAREHKLPVGKIGIVGNVAATGEPHIALDVGEDAVHFANPDLPNTHSEMGLPLQVRNRVIGVLDVQSTQEAAFSEEDVAVLQTLADQLASAIANARLFQNVRTDALRRALVNEVQQAAAASLNPEELLHRAGEVISRRLERPSAVFAWEEEQQHLVPIAIHDDRGEDVYLSEDVRVTRKMAPSLLSEVVDKRRICLLDPVAHHLGRSAVDLVSQVGIEEAIYVPLTAREQVLGVLAIAQTDGHFSEGMEFAETVGRNLSVALENARLYQDALETTEKLQEMDRLKSQFLANMSHELRTPLNSIIGFSRVILKGIDGPLTDMQRTDLEAVYNSGQHLLELINSILDISKIQAGKMELSFEETDLTEIIRVVMSTAKALVKDKPIDLQQSIPQELPTIRADGRRIRQILTNLVGNAAKFTEEGYIKVEAEPAGPEVIMRVIDTGVGIPEDKLESIFEEFTQVDGSSTRAVGGTGLGLSITRHFVEMHGGRIWAESVPDEGSVFYVALPIAGPPDHSEEAAEIEVQEKSPPLEEEKGVEGPEPGQKVVLCVDDDEGVIMLFRRYLSKQGYYVIGLTDGQSTLEKARTHKPFAITLDVMMPGKDGWAIIQELKSHPDTHDIPVIICSIISDQERGISLGASGYLVKPILESDLITALERLGREGKQKDGRQQVLVVDDHAEDRDLIRRMLESQKKYSVIEASSGQEAIAMIQVERPDVIVLDLMMPGIDGFAVLESVKANKDTRSIPIVVVTAKELTEEERRILNKGVETLLQKGLFEQQELLADVSSALERLAKNSQREKPLGHREKTPQKNERKSE